MQLLWRCEKIASQERSSSLAKAIGRASENEVGNAWNGTEMCQKPQMLTGMVNIDKQQLTESNCVFFNGFSEFLEILSLNLNLSLQRDPVPGRNHLHLGPQPYLAVKACYI